LLKRAVEEADGYYVGVPDLNGPTEVLARLRGTQRLALDFYEHPQHIKPALAEINRAWYDYWQACTAITHQPADTSSGWASGQSYRPPTCSRTSPA
jgi:hypothetical protein